MENNNILITGGAGYIGSHIAELLERLKFNVFIYDNLETGHKKLISNKSKFVKGDVKNFKKLSRVIYDNNITSVIHLASYLNIREAESKKKKYYKNNVGGTLNLVKACKNSNVKNIIFSSSCSVYGNKKGAVSEKNKLNPKSYYAYTKYKSEIILKCYSKKYKYNYAILRYFNVAGASSSGRIGEIEDSHGHLIKNLAIQSLKTKPKINVFGSNYKTRDGTCIRDYIHVVDLANVHIKILEKISKERKSFVLNCGYGKGYSVKEVIEIYKSIIKNVTVNYKKKRPGDIVQVYSNTKKIKKILKWKPKLDNLKKILLSAINWEKKLKLKLK